jgi:hypothetical protein
MCNEEGIDDLCFQCHKETLDQAPVFTFSWENQMQLMPYDSPANESPDAHD